MSQYVCLPMCLMTASYTFSMFNGFSFGLKSCSFSVNCTEAFRWFFFFPAIYAQINLSPFYFSWLGKAVGQPFFFSGVGALSTSRKEVGIQGQLIWKGQFFFFSVGCIHGSQFGIPIVWDWKETDFNLLSYLCHLLIDQKEMGVGAVLHIFKQCLQPGMWLQAYQRLQNTFCLFLST